MIKSSEGIGVNVGVGKSVGVGVDVGTEGLGLGVGEEVEITNIVTIVTAIMMVETTKPIFLLFISYSIV